MSPRDAAIAGKKVLVVDDEPDVCESVRDVLAVCDVDIAHTEDGAREKLSRGSYDVVILDVMGVGGYELLEEFARSAPCIMLTARALTPDDLRTAIAKHAVLYLPKDEMPRIDEYVERAITPAGSWEWLLRRVDFTRWFR
jgi:DNA-binding response OmpR family regulator